MLAPLFGLLAPPGPRARLSVLIFHRVLPGPDPMAPSAIDAARFDRLCARLAAWFRVLPLDEAVARLRAGTLPARAAAITFDDGYADNHALAMPILQRHGLSATFFVATGFLDGGRMWNDTLVEAVRATPLPLLDLRGAGLEGMETLPVGSWSEKRAAVRALIAATKYLPPAQRLRRVEAVAARCDAPLPDDLMMRSEQVLALRRGGMQVGAHTRSHPILAVLPRAEAREEIAASKTALEGLLGEPVRTFAYPNGKPGVDYSAESVELARELGFEVAVSTAWGAGRPDVDPLQVPRFTPWDRSGLRFGLRLAANLRRDGERVPMAPRAGLA